MHITFRQLQVFEAVARHLSYTRAAEELHLTQPAVSMQVKQLESSVGLPLFEQISKKIMSAVTDSGSVIAYDPACLGITNLLEIFGAMTGRNPEDIPADFEGKGYGDFKKVLAEAAVETLSPIRRKFDELMENKLGL